MKTLKITLVALFSIGLLTGVSAVDATEPIKENTNKEVKTPDLKLLVLIDKKRVKVPSNG